MPAAGAELIFNLEGMTLSEGLDAVTWKVGGLNVTSGGTAKSTSAGNLKLI
jgi:hypothetical protein